MPYDHSLLPTNPAYSIEQRFRAAINQVNTLKIALDLRNIERAPLPSNLI